MSSSSPPPLMMLLLINGFSPTELAASLGKLKSETKNLGTHNQRELYWKAYGDIQKDLNKYSDKSIDDGKLYGLVKHYRSMERDTDSEPRTEFEEFTKHQLALVQTPRVFMGRHIRLLVDDEGEVGTGKEFFMPWFGQDAENAYKDITEGEEAISIDSERGVFVSTRIKRKNCAGPPSKDQIKSMEALQKYIAELKADAPLQSIAWNSHTPPKVTTFNVILTGIWQNTITHHLPPSIAYTNTTSMHEVYDLFETRRNEEHIQEAELLITKMLTEIAKSHDSSAEHSVHTGSMKDLACARRNALLKKVYISSERKKFIEHAKEDGGFETVVIEPRHGSHVGAFEEYGGVVFETFYKLDLGIYG
mmetsp:Transcript_18791/g.46560  ORF Transcript_18791/g.46560 Transcript_18791/m.46560 type:complete len:362 (+) Transcript_18791:49-1134(+)